MDIKISHIVMIILLIFLAKIPYDGLFAKKIDPVTLNESTLPSNFKIHDNTLKNVVPRPKS